MAVDDRPGRTNRNNGAPSGRAAFAFIDRLCWGMSFENTTSTELHELSHSLGAVQNSAPHSSRRGHSYDDHDVMRYDAGGPNVRIVCSDEL